MNEIPKLNKKNMLIYIYSLLKVQNIYFRDSKSECKGWSKEQHHVMSQISWLLCHMWTIILTVSFRCSGNKSFSWAMHSLILSRLFFSISRCGNLYVSWRGSKRRQWDTGSSALTQHMRRENDRNSSRIYLAFVPALHAPPGFVHIHREIHSFGRDGKFVRL